MHKLLFVAVLVAGLAAIFAAGHHGARPTQPFPPVQMPRTGSPQPL